MEPVILVVDDEPAIRALVARILTRAGYRVRHAEDAAQALADVAAARPALVLTDQVLPGMAGHELVQLLTQPPEPIACILMSAVDPQLRLPGVPFLAKPFAVATLVQVVADTLAGPRSSLSCSEPCSAA